MRTEQLHEHARGMKAINEKTYSRSKTAILNIDTTMKLRQGEMIDSYIKWNLQRNPNDAREFQARTAQLIEDVEIGMSHVE